MNRRGFLKILASVGVVAAAAPAALAPPRSAPSDTNPLLSGQMGRYEGISLYEIKRHSELFDYGLRTGLCVSAMVSGRRYRHAALLPTRAWKQFRPHQKEETWRMIELKVLELAKRKEAGYG